MGFPVLMLTTMIGMHRVERWTGSWLPGRQLRLVPPLAEDPPDPYPEDPHAAEAGQPPIDQSAADGQAT